MTLACHSLWHICGTTLHLTKHRQRNIDSETSPLPPVGRKPTEQHVTEILGRSRWRWRVIVYRLSSSGSGPSATATVGTAPVAISHSRSTSTRW